MSVIFSEDFESGISGWWPASATVTQDTAQAMTGTHALKIVTANVLGAEGVDRNQTDPVTAVSSMIAIEGNTAYLWETWIYGSAANTTSTNSGGVRFLWDSYDTGLTYLGSLGRLTQQVPAADWTKFTVKVKTPPTAVWVNLRVITSSSQIFTCWIDSVTITKVASAMAKPLDPYQVIISRKTRPGTVPPDTFGNNTVGTVNDTQGNNLKNVTKYTVPLSGNVIMLTGYISGLGPGVGAQAVKGVMYADSAGLPGALMGVTDPILVNDNTAFSWRDMPFSVHVPVVAGTSVWMGYHGTTPNDGSQYKCLSGTGLKYNTDTYGDGPTDPFGTASTAALGQYSLYATYESGATGATGSTGSTGSTGATGGYGITGGTFAMYKGLSLYNKTSPNTSGDPVRARDYYGCKWGRSDYPDGAWCDSLASAGIQVLPIAGYNILSGNAHTNPSDHQLWANTVANKYVSDWRNCPVVEVWNEPWLDAFLNNAPSYLDLFIKAANALWLKNSSLKILVCADAKRGGYLWRQNLLAADTGNFLVDSRIRPVTHNYCGNRSPATRTGDPDGADFDRYVGCYNDFLAHGHPNPLVWVTEYGWETDEGTNHNQPPVSEATQSSYTQLAIQMMQSSGKVEMGNNFYLQISNSWTYNVLNVNTNAPKAVCAAVKAM